MIPSGSRRRVLSILPDSRHRDLPVQIRTRLLPSVTPPCEAHTTLRTGTFPSDPFNHFLQEGNPAAKHRPPRRSIADSWPSSSRRNSKRVRGREGDTKGLVGSPAVRTQSSGSHSPRGPVLRAGDLGRWGPRPVSHWKDALTWRPCRGCVGRQLSTMSSSASPSLLKLS